MRANPDVFWVKLNDNSQFRAYHNKIDRKHVDFLLCDPETMRPLVGIELDDKSHQRRDRQERDAFVDQVFNAAELPLVHIAAKRGYVVTELTSQLAPFLGAVSEPATTPSPATNQPPICPKCGGAMKLRATRNGANAGKRFWGCSNYPTCRAMLPYGQIA
jgi:hypothetical protein